MRVLIACEFSGTVRRAFRALGHEAWSCDLMPAEDGGEHYQADCRDVWHMGWDLIVAHPPCTYLTVSGNKWMKPEFSAKFPDRQQHREDAVSFFMQCYSAPAPMVAVENPIGIMSTRFRPPDQVIQPWMFGHGETKATCLWLRGLPLLAPTHLDNDLFAPPAPSERAQRLHKLPPSADRWKLRSKTYEGIAQAMAHQWGQVRAAA